SDTEIPMPSIDTTPIILMMLKGAWQDSDDEKVCVSLQSEFMLRQQSEKLYQTPNWATVPSKQKRQQILDSSDPLDDEPLEELEIRNNLTNIMNLTKKNYEYNEADTHYKSDILKILKKLCSNKSLKLQK
ncbi:15320_t:CDS:2, partial [Gigaspora margarita]